MVSLFDGGCDLGHFEGGFGRRFERWGRQAMCQRTNFGKRAAKRVDYPIRVDRLEVAVRTDGRTLRVPQADEDLDLREPGAEPFSGIARLHHRGGAHQRKADDPDLVGGNGVERLVGERLVGKRFAAYWIVEIQNGYPLQAVRLSNIQTTQAG